MASNFLTPWRRGLLTGGGPIGTGSLFDLHRQMNRLFDDLFDQGPRPAADGGLATLVGWPQIEIEQNQDRIQVTAELPGVDEKDIELSIEDGVLTLSGEKRSERKDENGYSERSYGRFERRVSLPSNVDDEKCSAEFNNGVLTISIPRAEEKSRGRRIPLASRSGKVIEAQNDANDAPRQEAAQESGGSSRQPEGRHG